MKHQKILDSYNFNEDISLSLIKNFPNLSLGIQDLTVIGINEFEQDTLFASKVFSVTLDVMSVINGDEIIIKKIRLDQPRIKALVLKDGKANWDIAKADTSAAEVPADTASSPFNLKLNSYAVRSITKSGCSLGNLFALNFSSLPSLKLY
jgi:uncharacterized protein involved in outer membrane biogenesis